MERGNTSHCSGYLYSVKPGKILPSYRTYKRQLGGEKEACLAWTGYQHLLARISYGRSKGTGNTITKTSLRCLTVKMT